MTGTVRTPPARHLPGGRAAQQQVLSTRLADRLGLWGSQPGVLVRTARGVCPVGSCRGRERPATTRSARRRHQSLRRADRRRDPLGRTVPAWDRRAVSYDRQPQQHAGDDQRGGGTGQPLHGRRRGAGADDPAAADPHGAGGRRIDGGRRRAGAPDCAEPCSDRRHARFTGVHDLADPTQRLHEGDGRRQPAPRPAGAVRRVGGRHVRVPHARVVAYGATRPRTHSPATVDSANTGAGTVAEASHQADVDDEEDDEGRPPRRRRRRPKKATTKKATTKKAVAKKR